MCSATDIPAGVQTGQFEGFVREFTHRIADDQSLGIEAIGIGGSYGQNSVPDRYSDLDFFLLTADGYLQSVLAGMEAFVRQLGSVIVFRGPIWVQGYGYSFTVAYQPLLLCHINVNSRETLTPGVERKYTTVLVDRTGFYTAFTERQQKTCVDHQALFESSCSLFWVRTLNVWRDLNRGDIWLALRHLADVRQQLFILVRLVHGIDSRDSRFPERNVEKDIPAQRLLALRDSLAAYDRESVVRALLFSMDFHADYGSHFAKEVGYSYPTVAAETISQIVRRPS